MSALPAFPRHLLSPHPASPRGPVRELGVSVGRDGGLLVLTYSLTGDLDAVLLPPPAPPERTDELWRHTCFEAFLARAGAGYLEFNLSPSGQWAAYEFERYRVGMRP